MTFLQRRDSYLKRKYGISKEDFAKLSIDQGGVCFICGASPKSRSLHVDHIHVKGYKKLPPEKKRLYVRGLLCFPCNKLLVGRGMTIEKAERLVKYLHRFMWNQVWV
jgi:hypothetical protein